MAQTKVKQHSKIKLKFLDRFKGIEIISITQKYPVGGSVTITCMPFLIYTYTFSGTGKGREIKTDENYFLGVNHMSIFVRIAS